MGAAAAAEAEAARMGGAAASLSSLPAVSHLVKKLRGPSCAEPVKIIRVERTESMSWTQLGGWTGVGGGEGWGWCRGEGGEPPHDRGGGGQPHTIRCARGAGEPRSEEVR